MKKFALAAKRVTALVIALLLSFSFVACNADKNPSGNGGNNNGKPTISVYVAKEIKSGEKVAVVVAVSDNSKYMVTSSNPSILSVKTEENGNDGVDFYLEISQYARVEKDTDVEITVELVNDSSVYAKRTITVKKNGAASAPIMAVAAKNPSSDSSKTVVRPGNDIRLDVEIENLPYDDKSFSVTFDEPEGYEGLLEYNASTGLISVKDTTKDIPKNGVPVTVKVTSNALSTLTKEVSVTVKPALKDGIVGDLTQDMLNAIANQKITVTSEIKDVVKYNSAEDGTSKDTYYNAVVKMDGDRWYGESSIANVKNPTVNANTYAKGDSDGKGNYYVNELYVNKNNVSTAKRLKDSDSNPVVWYDSDEDSHDGRHFWNHLSGLVLGKFEEESNDVYSYDIEPGAIEYDWIFQTYSYTPSEDEWLMAYVAWSFTPLLGSGDQFDQFRIVLKSDGNGGKTIDKIVASTAEVNLYEVDEEGGETVIGYQNTVCTFTFSDIGSTVVNNPAPYSETPESNRELYYNALSKALSAMSGKVDNYTFRMVENQQYAPSLDPNDYDMSGSASGSYTATAASDDGDKRSDTDVISTRNYASTSGTVGVRGYVTKEGALINETGQYTYSMDSYTYHTEVYGYKQNDNNTYETFKYDSEKGALIGTRRKDGQFADLLPDFDVSPYIFTFVKMESIGSTGKDLYTFALKDSAITSEVAYALTLADYASDAVSSMDRDNSLYVSVDSDGVLRSVGYAYDIASMYGGFYTTTYSDINTTALPEGIWDGYVARVVPQTWADFESVKYYADYSTIGTFLNLKGDAAVEKIFGATIAKDAGFAKLPAALSKAFRDGLNGPWHDYDENGTDSDGNTTYLEGLTFTVSYDLYDENYKIVDYYDGIIELLTTELGECGFEFDRANSGVRGSSTYTVYVNQNLGLRLKVESNMTRTFWLTLESTAAYWSIDG